MTGNTLTARILLDTERTIAPISPLLFGGFAEHMGRCIYGGIYDPRSAHADEHGLRRDVLAALKEVGYTTIRYPGGNFLSGYRWQDGVGPRERRPRRRDLAWQSVDTNAFGTDEFMAFCRTLGAEPMLGVNLGTGTIQDAADLVEYCNAPTGSSFADMRAANGHSDPYGVRLWCLGNEMDGPWQIGHLDAIDYGKKAREAAKMMKWQDPSIKLVLAGSSSTKMPTYPEWDRVALELCWEQVDYLSMHYYARNDENDTPSYLSYAAHFEQHVDTLAAVLRYVKALRRSAHNVFLSWDEWNVWYKDTSGRGGWQEGPPLSEELYNLEDALVVAQWLNVFLRKADVLKMACVAQIVNTISPLTTRGDRLLKQTTHYPIALVSRNASGVALDVLTQAPLYDTRVYGPMPVLDVAASYDAAQDKGALFVVNRSVQPVTAEVVWQGAAPVRLSGGYRFSGTDPKAANTFDQPDLIVPQTLPGEPLRDGRLTLALAPLSFTVLLTAGYSQP
ncbi:MAG TPA: alpha-L-arabinofuranosidase C-terminal domain-containing protein [Roseiflexaceae bacterium]|nr:alpha-L-arabinofuranosidase C-terminal domain-containing protein [Roseiflexaceae bacterium]